MNWKVKNLLEGKSIISREKGNSMVPLLKSRQAVRLEPITWKKCKKGDIVYCKVRKSHYTHLVKAKDKKRGVLIGNNHGKINGWTKSVYGKVSIIYE